MLSIRYPGHSRPSNIAQPTLTVLAVLGLIAGVPSVERAPGTKCRSSAYVNATYNLIVGKSFGRQPSRATTRGALA